ncbi:MAG: rhodanese-like domain-containing protein [Parvularculaceae bacterium]|nr:rhodanese-like domain-containing protein [Parvularculaceae bacterium]
MIALLTALMFFAGPDMGTLKNGVVHLSAAEAAELLEEGDVVILDVRTEKEFKAQRLDGATQIDFLDPRFKSRAATLDASKTYLVHCRSGRRSARALSTLKELGITNLYHLDGGMIAWTEKGLPTLPKPANDNQDGTK